MSTTVGQYPKTPSASAPAQGDHNKQEHGPTPGTPPNEHPPDFVSPRNDAIHDQRAPTAQQNVDTDPSGARANEYPPQAHAGKAGLGPHYYEQHRATLQDRIQGLKEELEGQIKHDEKLQQQGHDRITGELKEKQKREEEKRNPFHKSENEDRKTTDKLAASS